MAYQPPSKPGDRHPKIPGAKRFLGRYSYGKGLGDSDEYSVAFGVALMTWAPKFNAEIDRGRPGPRVNTAGIFDWAVQKQMGLLDGPVAAMKPLVLTIAGHMGPMTTGPGYWSARPLEERGLLDIQMVGYVNHTIPFQFRTGVNEANRLLHEPQLQVLNRPWAIATHSEGALVFSTLWQERNPDDPIWKTFRGGVQFGNPKRPMGVVAPWIGDKPDPGSEGLAPDCLTEPIPGVQEVSRRKDLYADKTPGPAAEYKVAIYRAVAYGQFFGRDSITEQMVELATRFGSEVWPVFQALGSGIGFLINMDPHNVYDLTPPRQHLERILLTDQAKAA